MNNKTTEFQNLGCNIERLDQLINGDQAAFDDSQLLHHLETCRSCREYLEKQAAAPNVWRDIPELLLQGEFDGASWGQHLTRGLGGQRQFNFDAVIHLLDASENPNSLGRWSDYEVVSMIGHGGMGIVFKADDLSLNRSVAIKVLAPHLAMSQDARNRFFREAQSAASVEHANVTGIYRVDQFRGLPYLVMPFIDGESLGQFLENNGPLRPQQVVEIAIQISSGLAAAHANGLVHRDVKPANILLQHKNDTTHVRLTDFGLARAVDDVSLTHQGAIAGTPEYMSPEQANGDRVTQATDLFSLGSVIYAMCTGEPPFKADNSLAMLRQIHERPPQPIEQLNPDIPIWLSQLTQKLMSKLPNQRFESAQAVTKILQACNEHLSSDGTKPLPPELIRFSNSRSRWFPRVVAAVAVAALVLVVGFYVSTNQRDDLADNDAESSGPIIKNSIDAETSDRHPSLATPLKIGDQVSELSVDSWLAGTPPKQIERNKINVVHFWATSDARRYFAFKEWQRVSIKYPQFSHLAICLDDPSSSPQSIKKSNMASHAEDDAIFARQNIGCDFSFGLGLDQSAVNWLAVTNGDDVVRSIIIAESGEVVWIGIPERLDNALGQTMQPKTLQQLINTAHREQEMTKRFRSAIQQNDLDTATELLPNMRSISPTMAAQLDYTRFRVGSYDADQNAPFSLATKLLADYPYQPTLLRNVASRLIRIIIDTTIAGDTPPEDWFKTALTLAQRSVVLTHRRDAQSLATLAQLHYGRFAIKDAITLQREAVKVSSSENRQQMQDVLAEYQVLATASN